MFYSILHHTDHAYSVPVSESVMEARMMPRTEGPQRCLAFELTTHPRAHVLHYQEHLENTVHHFDVPGLHQHLRLTARAVVEMLDDFPVIPPLDPEAWKEIDHLVAEGDYWEMLMPSRFVQFTPRLLELAKELNVVRRDDPYTLLAELNTRLHKAMAYVPHATKVDSPIDEALEKRKGVCQDYAHILLALVRHLGVPARYVSGYFFWGAEDDKVVDHGATHSWIEALLPGWGWVGFDPSNNLRAGARHIRVAVGRDYADVPPTRGVFKGEAESNVSVHVRVQEVKEGPKHAFSLPSEVEMA